MQTILDGFESGFYDYENEGELTVPDNWIPVWKQDDGEFRPEFDSKRKEDGHPEVRTGQRAANFFTTHATHKSAIVRKFSLSPGDKFTASVWCMPVVRGGNHGMRIAVDPEGSTDWLAENVVSSDWISSYNLGEDYNDIWRQVKVSGIAGSSGTISVFLQANADEPGQIMASHWDDFKLVIETSEDPPPPPPPDETLQKYIDILQIRITKTQKALDQLQEYINESQRTCILIQ